MSDPIELNRIWAMEAEFDLAADALARRDFRAFDEAMARFRDLEISTERGAALPNKRVASQ